MSAPSRPTVCIFALWGAVATAFAQPPGGGALPQPDPVHRQDPLRQRGAVEQQGAVQERDAAQFRAGVELVVVPVTVLDEEGRPVRGLHADAFRVLEDGEPREISVYLRPDDAPLYVALLLDASDSMERLAPEVREAAADFLNGLAPQDCVVVLPFSDSLGPEARGRGSDRSLQLAVGRFEIGGGTAVYDALLAALAALRDEPAADCSAAAEAGAPERSGRLDGSDRWRRAVVLLSDGEDRDSSVGVDRVFAAGRGSSVPIFPITLGRVGLIGRLLADLAEATGGRYTHAVTARGLADAYETVQTRLRASYVVGYAPDDPAATAGGLAPPGDDLPPSPSLPLGLAGSDQRWRELEVRVVGVGGDVRVMHRRRVYR